MSMMTEGSLPLIDQLEEMLKQKDEEIKILEERHTDYVSWSIEKIKLLQNELSLYKRNINDK